jgi:MoaD family protein
VKIKVTFYSYFKDLTGTPSVEETASPSETVSRLLDRIMARFPKLAPFRASALVAVGVEYQKGDYVLQEGDEVSLFPPVQGG